MSVPNWVLQPSKSWTWQADSGQSLGAALAEGSLRFLCALGEPLVRRVMPGMHLSLTFHRRWKEDSWAPSTSTGWGRSLVASYRSPPLEGRYAGSAFLMHFKNVLRVLSHICLATYKLVHYKLVQLFLQHKWIHRHMVLMGRLFGVSGQMEEGRREEGCLLFLPLQLERSNQKCKPQSQQEGKQTFSMQNLLIVYSLNM